MYKLHKNLFTLKALAAIATTIAFSSLASAQSADVLDRLAQGAVENGGEITWYESSPENQIKQVLAQFHKTYPKVKVRYIRLVGGNAVAARVIQEEQASGSSADVLTGGAAQLWHLWERDLLKDLSKENLELPEKLLPAPFAIPTAASVSVVMWNTNNVSDDEVPKNWDEIVDKKWTNRIGMWVRAGATSQLASVWGEEKAEKKLNELVALKPYLFKSTFPLAQGVASGEVDIAIGFYHSLQPIKKVGAPVDFRLLDPTPMWTISTSVTKSSKNPDAALLLATWLNTPEGAKAYEDATDRGNPLVDSTKTYKLLQDVQKAEFSFQKTDELAEVSKKFNAILAKGGSTAD